MKRLLVSILAWVTVFGLLFGEAAYASPELNFAPRSLYLADTPAQLGKDFITQIETEILPQLEQILKPDQLEQFQTEIAEGTSFRKAFKALMLTPEQKKQIKTVLKSAVKKDALASLTPEQKKQLIMKRKGMFKPTTEDITEKIETSLNSKGKELPAGIKEKVEADLKRKDSFIPDPQAITEKIESGINALKEKFED